MVWSNLGVVWSAAFPWDEPISEQTTARVVIHNHDVMLMWLQPLLDVIDEAQAEIDLELAALGLPRQWPGRACAPAHWMPRRAPLE